MATDVLPMQGARVSVAMLLTEFAQNILAPERLKKKTVVNAFFVVDSKSITFEKALMISVP